MERFVVVRQPYSRTEQVRVGTVLSRGGGGPVRVRWDDGEEEDVRLDSRNHLARRGSLRHQSLVDPTPLIERIGVDPVELIKQLLREAGSSMTARQIKEQLVVLGLDRKVVDARWKAAQQRLKKSRDVVSGKKPGSYKWAGGDRQPIDAVDEIAVSRCVSEGNADDSAAGAPETAGVPEKSGAPEKPSVAETPSVPEKPSVPKKSSVPKRAGKNTHAPANSLARVLGDKPPKAIHDYAKTPLGTATRLSRLDDSTINDLLAKSSGSDRPLFAAMCAAIPKQVAFLDLAAPTEAHGSKAFHRVLRSAALEARGPDEMDRDTRLAVAALVRRSAGVDTLGAAAVAPLIELCNCLRSKDKAYLEALDGAALVLSRLLPQLSPGAGADINIDDVAETFARLPLQRNGGRLALLVTVARVWPEHVVDPRWWRALMVRDLAECASGALASVLAMPSVAEQIIRPLLVSELSATVDRTRLAFLVGLPAAFAARLPADAVSAAFARIAGTDPILSGWLASLSHDGRVEELERDLEQAGRELTAAKAQAESGDRRATELAERCERLEEILRGEHAQSVALKASHERQLQIDVVRALAELAAEVEELATTDAEPDVLVERVRALVASQALEPIGRTGEESAFDPALHDPLIAAPENGATVSIIRPGYRWQFSGEGVLISKATVSVM